MRRINDVPKRSPIPNQEAVRVGNLMVLAQQDEGTLNRQKQHLLVKLYQINETPHFVVCRKQSSPRVVLMHKFRQENIDADLICFIENELTPLGIISSAKEFGATLFAILASTFPSPRDQPTIWRRFYLNTLKKLRDQVNHPLNMPSKVSYIAPFAAIYRRVFALCAGQSLLDVGCSFGFLPVLMAERIPDMRIVGCDNNPDALNFSNDLTAVSGIRNVTFVLKDILSPDIVEIGHFDTVTAIHLLEHLSEADVPIAFTHLLNLASERLVIAVPYEKQAQALYGHHQVFTPEKLHHWGLWCVEHHNSAGHYWVEEVMGGMLVIERERDLS